eukprot:TRINITY_DN14645_c0_g1_i1.p1 TRINITY_DN14645_c0_g1~~TRINITY_DN14645_c0_g1_i1.p1  ORF type:complete len:301 (+),score=61.74 TRINITY_DN14645_c0_g1_i1:40-942(+)
MSEYEEPLSTPEVEVEVEEAYPSLLWVLLTRFDGFCTVVFVAGLIFLLCRALLSVQSRLEAAQAELSQKNDAVADTRRVHELTAALRHKDVILDEKQGELSHLLSLVQDADQQYSKANTVERQVQLLQRDLSQMQEEKELIERSLTVELGDVKDRNCQLQVAVDDLTVQLAAAHENMLQKESMLDLVVAQHQKQRPMTGRVTPKSGTPSRREFMPRSDSPGLPPTTSPMRIKPASYKLSTSYSHQPSLPASVTPQGYSSIPRRRLPEPIRSHEFDRIQKSQNDYLEHLDAQINMLQNNLA